MHYEGRFLLALALTVGVEGAAILIMVYCIPHIRNRGIPLSRNLIAAIVPSFATLPYLWFVLPAYISSYPLRLIAGETAVILIESVLITSFISLRIRTAAMLSLIANSASIIAGLLVF